jgi:hypothetical protein
MASAGFEPANLGNLRQHATPRPPKPLWEDLAFEFPVRERAKQETRCVMDVKQDNVFFFLRLGVRDQIVRPPLFMVAVLSIFFC